MKKLIIVILLFMLVFLPQIPGRAEQGGLPQQITMRGEFKLITALKHAAESAGKSLVLGKGVEEADIRLDLQDVTLGHALNTMLFPRGYGYRVNGNELVILAVESKVFRLVLPPIEQRLDTVTSNESQTDNRTESNGSNSAKVKVGTKVQVENLVEKLSYWEDVERNVKTLLSSSGSVSLNRVGGVMLVTDSPVVLACVEKFIDELNKRVSRQILVDVKVVEVELSNEYRLGIDWSVLMNRGDLKGLKAVSSMTPDGFPLTGAFTLSASVDKAGSGEAEDGIKTLIHALDTYGRVEVVSQPRVAMLNNTVANIQVGQTRSYVESSNIETTQGGGTIVSGSLGEVHGGVTLQIVGNMVGDEIFLNVTPVVSSVDDIRTISLGGGSKLEAPETSTKSMNAMVRLKERETAVIGGLITRSANKQHYGVPVLGRVPVLGKLFSYDSIKRSRVELVVLITPRRG